MAVNFKFFYGDFSFPPAKFSGIIFCTDGIQLDAMNKGSEDYLTKAGMSFRPFSRY
jgi:hypothetical protein